MANDFQPSPEYADFFFQAIDHAFGSIENGGGPLIPFVMTIDKEGKKHMQRYVAERIEEGIVHAQNYIDENQGNLEMYAIAWDGYITSENKRTDAVFVEAGERNDSRGVTFCQRYREEKKGLFKGKKCERIGNPALIERPITRFN